MSRQFNGTTDKIVCSIGGCNLTGALTWVFLFRRNSTAAYHALGATLTSGGVPASTLEIESNGSGNKFELGRDDTVFVTSTGATFSTLTNWYIVAVSKGAGAVTARIHYFNVTGGGAWTHSDFNATLDNAASQAGGTVNFSNYKAAAQDPFNGWLAAAAVWAGTALSDSQAAELSTNLKTSDWWNNSAGHPAGLWQFNGTVAAGITDLSGNSANQSSISGTTQDTGTDPPGWSYDGIGGTGATVNAVPALSAGSAPAAVVSAGGTSATVTAVPALSAGTAPVAAVRAGATVTAVAAVSAGSAPPANQIISIVVDAPAVISLGSAPAAAVTAGGTGATVNAVPALSAGSAPVATVQAGVSVTAVTALSAGSAPAAAATQGVTVTGVPAVSTGQAPRPTISPAPVGGAGTAQLAATFAEDAA